MDLFIYQLKQAFLSLKKKPGFVFSVVSTMGVTLGALLCVFTLAYVMLIKPLPYPDPEKLYVASNEHVDAKGQLMFEAFSYPALMALYNQSDIFSQSALVAFKRGVLLSQQDLPMIEATFTSPQWFSLTGMKMAKGRPFERSENVNSYNPVTVISYETWQDNFSADKDIIGKNINFDNVSYQIIGVVGKNYIEPQVYAYHRGASAYRKTQIWLPWDFNRTETEVRKIWWRTTSGMVVGKLSSELSVKQAEQRASSLVNEQWLAAIVGDERFTGKTQRIAVHDFKKVIVGDNKETVYFLLAGIIGLVIIAFTNIANLMTSRAFMQQRNIAIQAAIGAKQSTLFNVFFSEALVLVFFSLLVGMAFALFGFALIEYYLSASLARSNEMGVNVFTLVSSIVILFVFAWTFAKISLNSINKKTLAVTINTSGKGTGSQLPKILRQLLIICQVTVASVLIFISLNLFKEAMNAINTSSNLNIDRTIALTLAPTNTIEMNAEATLADLTLIKQKLAELPQVEALSHSASPFSSFSRWWGGLTDQDSNKKHNMVYRIIDAKYFSLLNQSQISGDNFTDDDVLDQNNVMIVNDALANEISVNGKVIGNKVFFRDDRVFTIIGVVKGMKVPAEQDIAKRVYLPRSAVYELRPEEKQSILIKLKNKQEITRDQVIDVIKSVSSSFSIDKLESLEDVRYQRLFNNIVTAIVTAIVALLSLILAGIGIYGILSYSIQIRRFEIGARLAIGAKRINILALVFKDNIGGIFVGFVVSGILLLCLFLNLNHYLNPYISLEMLGLFMLTLSLILIISFLACYLPLRQFINKPVVHTLKGNE
jgi:predicted permease